MRDLDVNSSSYCEMPVVTVMLQAIYLAKGKKFLIISKWLASSATFVIHAGGSRRKYNPLTKGFSVEIISSFQFGYGQLHHYSFRRACTNVAKFP